MMLLPTYRSGFTLIELMVAIGILVVTASAVSGISAVDGARMSGREGVSGGS